MAMFPNAQAALPQQQQQQDDVPEVGVHQQLHVEDAADAWDIPEDDPNGAPADWQAPVEEPQDWEEAPAADHWPPHDEQIVGNPAALPVGLLALGLAPLPPVMGFAALQFQVDAPAAAAVNIDPFHLAAAPPVPAAAIALPNPNPNPLLHPVAPPPAVAAIIPNPNPLQPAVPVPNPILNQEPAALHPEVEAVPVVANAPPAPAPPVPANPNPLPPAAAPPAPANPIAIPMPADGSLFAQNHFQLPNNHLPPFPGQFWNFAIRPFDVPGCSFCSNGRMACTSCRNHGFRR